MAEERVQRRLAAVLAADVVGYSRMMEVDETGTRARFNAHLNELIKPAIANRQGRTVKTMGDGLLVEFASVVDAVECAVEIQNGMMDRNVDEQTDQRIEFRIGVNLGDVIIEGDDIHGDGVNVAARLEGLAEPGTVFISYDVFRQVEGKVDAIFEDLGERRVKNIAKPLQVFRVRSQNDLIPRSPATVLTQPTSDIPSIAVLPFANMSGDPEQEYFTDGLTEDIITAFTRWRSFLVIARNSCFAYKDKSIDIKQVARELGARYVLEGSVRKGGERVRITAQLIDGIGGHHLWADKYDRNLDDIFEVQDDMVQRIAAIVIPELGKAELQRSVGKRSEDLDAWDLCLRAKPLLRQKTREGNTDARKLFMRAIAIRANYVDAHAGLAQSYSQDVIIGAAEDRARTATQAMEAAANAVRCDEASSWARHELSTAYQLLNRVDDALEEAQKAVELNPNDAYALHALGNKSDLAGDSDGIVHMEKAQKLNPEDAQRFTHLTFLARAYVAAGDYNTAVERARQAIRRRPDYAAAHYVLGIALGHSGQLDEACASLKMCDELTPGFVASRQTWNPYADDAKNLKLLEGRQAAIG
jgi:adenylate cyclase